MERDDMCARVSAEVGEKLKYWQLKSQAYHSAKEYDDPGRNQSQKYPQDDKAQ